jgi:DNA-binding response OmpR family regulator
MHSVEPHASEGREKILIVGTDDKQTVEKKFRLAGFDVLSAANREIALALSRYQKIDRAVVVSQGSLVNVTETVFSLKDLRPNIKIIVLLQRGTKPTNRFLRQLLEHPIEGSEIMTRRELQRHLRVR